MNSKTDHLLGGLRLGGPADHALVERVQAELRVTFPPDYVEFMEAHNGAEGWVGEQYLILYPLDQLVMLNDVGGIKESFPGLVLFGSNGGGMDYLFHAGSAPARIVTGPDIGATEASLRVCGDSFEAFLCYLHELIED